MQCIASLTPVCADNCSMHKSVVEHVPVATIHAHCILNSALDFDGAGVMGLMSVWVGGMDKPCTGQFGASAMSAMSMSTPATAEHPLKNGEGRPFPTTLF